MHIYILKKDTTLEMFRIIGETLGDWICGTVNLAMYLSDFVVKKFIPNFPFNVSHASNC
jgi:hypothetical protein